MTKWWPRTKWWLECEIKVKAGIEIHKLLHQRRNGWSHNNKWNPIYLCIQSKYTYTHSAKHWGCNDKGDRNGPCLHGIYNLLLLHNSLKSYVGKDDRIKDNLEYPYLKGLNVKGKKKPQRRQRSSSEKSVRIAKIIQYFRSQQEQERVVSRRLSFRERCWMLVTSIQGRGQWPRKGQTTCSSGRWYHYISSMVRWS